MYINKEDSVTLSQVYMYTCIYVCSYSIVILSIMIDSIKTSMFAYESLVIVSIMIDTI